MSEETKIECVLCRKEYKYKPYSAGLETIRPSREVCRQCEETWKVGRRAMGAEKKDGKMVHATVANELPMVSKFGNPQGPTEVRSADIIAAMGGVRTRGTGQRYLGPKIDIRLLEPQDKEEYYTYIRGGEDPFMVQQARANAMKKIISAFLNAIAKARVDGVQEGRSLLAGLAKGTLLIEDFSSVSDRVANGKKPKRD